MTLFLRTVFIGIFCLASGVASAEPSSAQTIFKAAELFEMCNSSYDTDYGFCAGYISSIAEILAHQPISGYRACHHQIVQSQQLVDLFKNYAEVYPEMMAGSASVAVAASFARAFPCHVP
jgi:hypothetical protein